MIEIIIGSLAALLVAAGLAALYLRDLVAFIDKLDEDR